MCAAGSAPYGPPFRGQEEALVGSSNKSATPNINHADFN